MIQVFPRLSTGHLDLVEITPPHARDMFRLMTDETVKQYYPVRSFSWANDMLPVIQSFRTKFIARESIRWGIAQKGYGSIIGTIGFNNYRQGQKGTVLFAILPEYHGRGYATEALTEVARYGFDKLQLKRIDAEVLPGNAASERLLDKVGFKHEGLLQKWIYLNGEQYDVNMYSLVQ